MFPLLVCPFSGAINLQCKLSELSQSLLWVSSKSGNCSNFVSCSLSTFFSLQMCLSVLFIYFKFCHPSLDTASEFARVGLGPRPIMDSKRRANQHQFSKLTIFVHTTSICLLIELTQLRRREVKSGDKKGEDKIK